MIENKIKNELTRKKWNRFKKNKLALYSGLILLIMFFLSCMARHLANSRPLLLKHSGTYYFPTLKEYHPSIFKNDDMFVMNYRSLDLGEDDFVIWPLIRWDPFESNENVDYYPSKPTSSNILGTDESGRDVLTRILYGHWYSSIFSLSVWCISYLIGIFLGAVMGHFGGKIDLLGQRLVEIFSTVPTLFLILILVANFNPNILWLIIIASIFGWIGISYYVRGEFLKNRNKEYVEAARSIGVKNFTLMFKHILPNSLGPVVTFSPFFIAAQIAALASLDYLGLGLPVPTPSLGELLNQAYKNFTTAWWLALYPSLALFLTLAFLTFLGDGIRDAIDPHIKE